MNRFSRLSRLLLGAIVVDIYEFVNFFNRTGKPVRCMLDRNEDMMTTGTRHPFLAKYKVNTVVWPLYRHSMRHLVKKIKSAILSGS